MVGGAAVPSWGERRMGREKGEDGSQVRDGYPVTIDFHVRKKMRLSGAEYTTHSLFH